MKQLFSLIAALLIAVNAYADAVVTPELAKSVVLSNTDINRVVCQEGDINDVFYSQEKGMTVINKGSNAFVKYLIKKKGGKELYVTQSTELHIICHGLTYTLIAQPQRVSTQTVYLSEGVKTRIERNREMFSGMDYEEKILHLTQQIYRDEIPDNFRVSENMTHITVKPTEKALVPLFKSITITKVKDIEAEGMGLSASEYFVVAKQRVKMLEVDFLQREFGSDIAAVTLTPLELNPKESARLIIIWKGGKR